MRLDVIDSLSKEDWEWGVMDCCQFARRFLIESTGKDFAEGQPEYSNSFEAAKIVARAGGMEPFISSMLGDPVPRNQVRRGDVCLADFPTGLATGICVGQTAAFASKDGVVFIPMARVIKGWNVNG